MPTWTACAARVRVNRINGHVTVEKLSLVIDAGAEAQVEAILVDLQGPDV